MSVQVEPEYAKGFWRQNGLLKMCPWNQGKLSSTLNQNLSKCILMGWFGAFAQF